MLTKPFGIKEGFLVGGCLIIAGLMLQLSVGPIVWHAFRWPINGIVLAGFLLLITIFHLLRKKVYAFQFIGTYKAAVSALTYAVLLTVILGLTRQTEDGTWLNNMLSFWPFVLVYVYIAMILGMTVLKQLKSWATANFSTSNFKPSTLSHLGLFIAMTAATLGNSDMQRVKMITVKGVSEWRAIDQYNRIVQMPFAIELKDFIMETYDDGKPKRFASDIIIAPHDKPLVSVTIDVNKPAEMDGWKIYQYGYDTQMGTESQMSILELVSDPWLLLVYTGFYMMMGGAILMILRAIPWREGIRKTRKNPKASLMLFTLVAICFFCVHHFMPILHSDSLVPALQSPWFKPHIIVYMMAYTLMGAAAIIALYLLSMARNHNSHFSILNSQLDNIVYIGISLITFGMLFGAFWAKEAWGHYWEWDPKETWAAITWLAYLVYVHYKQIPTHKPKLALWVIIISFVLLQMCWWGIKFLPAAQGASVHVYTN